MNSTSTLPEVSIVVPLFNAERYLAQCLRSIQKQSFADLEILIVDDVSTDKSVQIAHEILNNDPRLRVLKHDHNQGAGEARNTGLRNSTAPWVVFVDSDDWIDNTYVEVLYRTAKAHNADIVQCGANWVYPDRTLIKPAYPFRHAVINGHHIIQSYGRWEGDASILCMPWGKIFRRRLFTDNNVFYPPIIGEDVPATYQLCFFARKAIILSAPLYYYRQHADSVTSGKISSQTAGDIFIAMQLIHDFLLQQHPNEQGFSQFADMAFRHVIWQTLYKMRLSYAEDISKYRQMVRLADESYLRHRKVFKFDHRYIHYSLRFAYEVNPLLLKEWIQYYWGKFPKKQLLKGLLGLIFFWLINAKPFSSLFGERRSMIMSMKKLTGFGTRGQVNEHTP